MKESMITNENLKKLISDLKLKSEQQNSNLLERVADDLERPTRIRREVNLSRINRYTKEGETIIVPGKVLGGGELDHKVIISAFKFSESALSKLKKSGSVIIPLQDVAKQPLTGKKVRIIG
jgi:large subunit ribosomal protein L18e